MTNTRTLLTVREMVLVSRSPDRAGGNCKVKVNKVTSPSTNVFALLSKKSYPRSTRLPTWRWREWRRRILGCLWNRYKVEKASTQALRKDSRYFWHHFSWRVSNKVQVWHNRASSLSSRIQNLVFFLKSYHTSCHRLITIAAGSS